MKKWVMILLVVLVSLGTGAGYYYYNYIYKAPGAEENRELAETNSAYEYLIYDAGNRMAIKGYKYRVLINPVGGGSDTGVISGALKESDAVLGVARYVESLNEDESLGIFMTRDTDTNPSYDQRVSFIKEVDPDMIIELKLNSSDDASVMGTSMWYDDGYYDYHLVNSHLADVMEKSVVTRIGGVAEGIFPLADDTSELVKDVRRPAVVIKMGYATNAKEAEALLSETYRSNIALGILDAIKEIRGIEDEPEAAETGSDEDATTDAGSGEATTDSGSGEAVAGTGEEQ